MKKKIFCLYALLACLVPLFAQTVQSLPVLTSYTIPVNEKGVVIGSLLMNGKKTEATIVKDTAGIFRLSKGLIRLKSNVALHSSGNAFRYALTLKAQNTVFTFELVKDEFIHNKVVAHRGAYKNHGFTENTINSLKKAIEIGCEGSEFDVWLSSDNVPVICHDGSVQGKQIEKTIAEELQKVDLKNGDAVPMLQQYINTIQTQNKTCLFLEVKSSGISQERSLAVADSSVLMVHKMHAQGWVKYISFNYGVLQRIRQLDPSANIAYLSGDKKVDELKKDKISGIDYPFYSFHSDKNLTADARNAGLSVNVWTVDKKEEMEFLLNCGVNLITTNEPEMLMALIAAKK